MTPDQKAYLSIFVYFNLVIANIVFWVWFIYKITH